MLTSGQLLQKRIENQEKILRIFEDVPLIFNEACETVQLHPADSALRQSVLDLYQALVREIPILVDILLRRHKGPR